MKIAMIGQKGIPAIYGGIERHVEDLSKELGLLGHEVLVYTRQWYAPQAITHKNVKTIATPTIHTKHLDAIVHTFTATVHALFQKPDVIHYHGVGPSLLSFIPRLLSPKTKVVATFHTIDRFHQKWGWFARFVLKLGERAVCAFPHQTITVSKTIKNYCLNEYQKLTTFIPNGVGRAQPAQAELLTTWDIKPNHYVLMVSRLVGHKGAHYLVAAWKLLQKQNTKLIAGLKLVIAGDSAFTDNYVLELKDLANHDPSIVFAGWQKGEALNQLYANATLVVHPSENEGLPITVLQAMSHGRAVLVSDIPEHQEVITDKRFWFSNASVTSLADKMAELLATPERLERAGQENKMLVQSNYNWQNITLKTEQLYLKPYRHKKGRAELQAA